MTIDTIHGAIENAMNNAKIQRLACAALQLNFRVSSFGQITAKKSEKIEAGGFERGCCSDRLSTACGTQNIF